MLQDLLADSTFPTMNIYHFVTVILSPAATWSPQRRWRSCNALEKSSTGVFGTCNEGRIHPWLSGSHHLVMLGGAHCNLFFFTTWFLTYPTMAKCVWTWWCQSHEVIWALTSLWTFGSLYDCGHAPYSVVYLPLLQWIPPCVTADAKRFWWWVAEQVCQT